MSRWVNESQTIHNYISGGVGGNGGEGHEQGTGGGGGAGEGPTVTTTIEAVTVHLNQNHHLGGAWQSCSGQHGRFEGASRELPGPTRSHQRRVGWTPYDLASRALSRRGFNEESTASQNASSSTQSMSGFHSARATSHTSFGSFSAPYRFDPQLAHPVDHYPRNQADRVGFSTPSHQNYHPDWVGDDTFPAFERHQIPEPSQPIHAPTFITAETLNHHPGEAGINILHKAAALEALFDSADSYPQPRCHPETRIDILDTLHNWAVEGDSACPVRWLHGPAGAGKSAIMQTLCQRLQTAGRLGGAFFFKRDHLSRGNAKVLFATLAYQLALNNDTLKSVICQTVECDPSVVARSMDAQLRQLIVEPCQSLINRPHAILLIDGLDECQNESTHQEILRLIKTAVIAKRPSETFRFLIASRPEAHIREFIEDPSFVGIVDSLNVTKSFEDVENFFFDQFSRIHREHWTMANIPTPWPSWEILDHLVKKSSGYFIYASTVIKFIDDKYSRPTERLSVIHSLSATQHDTPFVALDQLYIQILSLVPTHFHSTLRDILQCTIMVNLELTPAQLDRLFDLEPGDVQLILRSLHSVLKVPADSETISVHHASFSDFLKDPQRSSIFYPDLENRMNVARAVIKALSDDNHWLDTPENPLAWRLNGKHLIKCITVVPPAAGLIPLIEGVNPDFLWGTEFGYKWGKEIQEILIWLKKIQPVPVDLIRRWEDYNFMFFWDIVQEPSLHDQKWTNQVLFLSPKMLSVLQTKMSGSLLMSLEDCRQVVARSPGFARIFQARMLFYTHLYRPELPSFYQLRLLLKGVSWDDIMAALSIMCSIVGGGSQERVVAGTITILALSLELYPANIPGLISDLSCGLLCLIQRKGVADSIPYSWNHFNTYGVHFNWARLIRCSPPLSPDLLSQLYEFVPPWDWFPSQNCPFDCLCVDEFYNIVQWLKALPDPPLELIDQWQGYLTKSRDRFSQTEAKCDYNKDNKDLENLWQESNEFKCFNDSGAKFHAFDEEEVIRHWEHVLEEIREEAASEHLDDSNGAEVE